MAPQSRQIIHVKVEGRLTRRDLALRRVSAACRAVLATTGRPTDRRRLVLHMISAVGEAFNNIALHGYRDDATPGAVEIDVSFDQQAGLAVEMRDYGRSFDPRSAVPPKLDTLPESGMGAFIMNTLMDEIEYRPGRPNVLTLVKRLT